MYLLYSFCEIVQIFAAPKYSNITDRKINLNTDKPFLHLFSCNTDNNSRK